MKYIKPELEKIELLDPTLFVSCSGGTDNPDVPGDEGGGGNPEYDPIGWKDDD